MWNKLLIWLGIRRKPFEFKSMSKAEVEYNIKQAMIRNFAKSRNKIGR